MESPLKRRAQDDLASPRRKFRPCKFHRLPFFIHEAGSINESLVNALPSVSDQISLTEDKENVDPNPFEYHHGAGSRCSSRTPLQAYSDTGTHLDKEKYHVTKYAECWKTFDREQHAADAGSHSAERCNPPPEYIGTEVNVGTGDSDTDSNEDCLVTHDGELYTTVTGPLARSSGEEWKTLKRLQFEDEVFPLENPQWIVF